MLRKSGAMEMISLRLASDRITLPRTPKASELTFSQFFGSPAQRTRLASDRWSRASHNSSVLCVTWSQRRSESTRTRVSASPPCSVSSMVMISWAM